jgi:hypothetical protein
MMRSSALLTARRGCLRVSRWTGRGGGEVSSHTLSYSCRYTMKGRVRLFEMHSAPTKDKACSTSIYSLAQHNSQPLQTDNPNSNYQPTPLPRSAQPQKGRED